MKKKYEKKKTKKKVLRLEGDVKSNWWRRKNDFFYAALLLASKHDSKDAVRGKINVSWWRGLSEVLPSSPVGFGFPVHFLMCKWFWGCRFFHELCLLARVVLLMNHFNMAVLVYAVLFNFTVKTVTLFSIWQSRQLLYFLILHFCFVLFFDVLLQNHVIIYIPEELKICVNNEQCYCYSVFSLLL